MAYIYTYMPMGMTPRSCTVCLQPANQMRFQTNETGGLDNSSREFVCAEHGRKDRVIEQPAEQAA